MTSQISQYVRHAASITHMQRRRRHMTARGLISLVSLIFCSVPCDRLSWLPVSFYRAMLCAARTMAVARCLSVHPTVCPSVTRHYCAETAKHIIKLFQSHHSRFSLPNVMAIFQQIPPPGRGRRMQMKNRDFFDRYLASSRK